MDDETVNLSVRRFLKEFGVSAQREIERALEQAIVEGKLQGSESLNASAILRIDAIGLDHAIEGQIRLA